MNKFEQLLHLQSKAFESIYELVSIDQKYKNWFKLLCPICSTISLRERNNFKIKIDNDDSFSIEHIPPENLGGLELCLTHTKCNNDYGKFEAEFKKQKLTSKGIFDKRHSPHIKTEKGIIPCNLDFSNKNNLQIQMVGSHQNPNIDLFSKKLYNGSEFNICFNLYNDKKIKASIIKTGYLILFVKYGHGLVCQNSYDLVREKIKFPDSPIIKNPGFFVEETFQDGIYLSDEINAVCVLFKGFISFFPRGGKYGIGVKLIEIWQAENKDLKFNLNMKKISDLPKIPLFEFDFKTENRRKIYLLKNKFVSKKEFEDFKDL